MVQAGGDEQAVERQLHVEPAGRAVADRDAELLLDRRAGVEARVVVGAEEMRLAKVGELGSQGLGRRDEIGVVAGAVGLEPVAIVGSVSVAGPRNRRWALGERARSGANRSQSVCRGFLACS